MADRGPVPLVLAGPGSPRGTRVLDQAFHEWGNVEDDRVQAALAPALRATYEHDPDHRPDIADAMDRHLLRANMR